MSTLVIWDEFLMLEVQDRVPAVLSGKTKKRGFKPAKSPWYFLAGNPRQCRGLKKKHPVKLGLNKFI